MIPARLAAFASRIGLTGLALAILAALLAVQTVRLEGFKLWPLSIEGARPKAERLQRTIAEFARAQDQALAAAELARAKAEAEYRNLAERIDADAKETRAGALADAERYIAANRVRCPPYRGAAGQASAPAADRGAGNGEGPGAAPVVDDAVAVKAEDVRICTTNTLQAEAARAWALELEKGAGY